HNFDLAIEYYKQAQSYDDTIQVRNNIEHAKRSGLILQPPPVPVVQKTNSSKKSPVSWIVGSVLLLTILGVVAYVANNSHSNTYSPDYKKEYEESAMTAEPVPAYENPASNNPANTFDMIIGSWHVEDRVVNNISSKNLGTLLPASWTFYNDRSVSYTINENYDTGSWTNEETNLSVTLSLWGSIPGYISSINNNSMTWITSEMYLGQQVLVTNYLTKQ
ncbi:MAG TPA: hypothetical protein VMZ69_03865, partial [Saprospiraceae bacterium]|nr:hypothetical protein [Saprospiraceae bacterium]